MSLVRTGRVAAGGSSSRATQLVLTLGALSSAACLLMAIVLELLGRPTAGGDPLDIGSLVAAVVDLRPWGWATIGVITVIATPIVGLVATAIEYAGRRESILALAVLGILGLSLFIALLR
jgi:uncharacterized membrane protein